MSTDLCQVARNSINHRGFQVLIGLSPQKGAQRPYLGVGSKK